MNAPPPDPATGAAPDAAADSFATLFAFLPIGAYRSSPDGRQLRANPALAALNGFADEAEQLAAVSDIASAWYVDPQRRQVFKDLLERDGRVVGFESEVWRYKSRERIWVSENAHIVRDAQGRTLYYEGTVEEITARVRDREVLRRTEQQLRQIVDLVPGVIYRVLSDDGGGAQVDFVSPSVEQLFGVAPGQVVADPRALRALRHPDDRARVDAEIQAASRERRPLDIEFRILLPDGRERWIAQTNAIAPPEGGMEVRVGLMLDITARKLAEQALRVNSLLWKEALESTGDGVWDWDLETGVEQLSSRCKALYGFGPDELPDSPDALDALTHPEDKPRMLRDRENHFAGRTPRYVNEHRVRCKDGHWKWILSRGIVISRGADGRPLRMIGTHTDIQARKQADELRRQRDIAQAADVAKSQFLSRVSHELRTPLNAVLGFAQLLELDPGIQADARHLGWVRQVLSSGRHLLGLMDDVLDLSAAESGELPVHPEPVLLAPLVGEAWKLVAHSALPAGLRFANHAADSALRVQADRKRLRQVLVNLLSNAIKYNRPGGWIEVSAVEDGGHVVVSVADSGSGLSAAQTERLFQPFERLGAQRGPVPGTGLGLALCRQLVNAMGGVISAESTPGTGSVFRVSLRRASDAAPAAAPAH